MSLREPLVSTDVKHTALALALGGRLVRTDPLDNGRLAFVVEGAPPDLAERVLNDEIVVSARKFIDALEGILGIIASRRRAR